MKNTIYTYKGIPIYNGMEVVLNSGHKVKINTEEYGKQNFGAHGSSFFYLTGNGPNLNGGHCVNKFGAKFAWAWAPKINSRNEIGEMPGRLHIDSLKKAEQFERHYEIF